MLLPKDGRSIARDCGFRHDGGRMIGMLLGRLLLGRSRGIGPRRRRSPLVPENSRLRGINSRFDRKISRFAVDGNFLATHCLKACIFARIAGFGAESNEFRVIFPVIPVLREFRSAGAGSGRLHDTGSARGDPEPILTAARHGSLTALTSNAGARFEAPETIPAPWRSSPRGGPIRSFKGPLQGSGS